MVHVCLYLIPAVCVELWKRRWPQVSLVLEYILPLNNVYFSLSGKSYLSVKFICSCSYSHTGRTSSAYWRFILSEVSQTHTHNEKTEHAQYQNRRVEYDYSVWIVSQLIPYFRRCEQLPCLFYYKSPVTPTLATNPSVQWRHPFALRAKCTYWFIHFLW